MIQKGGFNNYRSDASFSEIGSTHIENLIRSEHGLPLKTHYFKIKGTRLGDEDQILNINNRTRRFIDINGKIHYKPLKKISSHSNINHNMQLHKNRI